MNKSENIKQTTSTTRRAKPTGKNAKQTMHPVFEMLHSGESMNAAYVPPENLTNAQVSVAFYLEDIFEAKRQADDLGCQVHGLYDAVRHNPELKQEVAAMKALFDALNVLQRFIFSTQ